MTGLYWALGIFAAAVLIGYAVYMVRDLIRASDTEETDDWPF